MILPDLKFCHPRLKPFFSVPNPVKRKMIALQKMAHFYPDEIFLGKGELLPPGLPYWSVVRGFGQVESTRPHPLLKKNTTIELRKEQIPVFEACRDNRAGLAEFKTGAGKSVIACALADCWGGKTLIIAHSVDNVAYFREQFKKFLDREVGTYYGARKKMMDITITTFATAAIHINKFREYGFDNLIVDEADIFFTEKKRDLITAFPCARKWAFTGTIKTAPDEYMSRGEVPALRRYWGLHVVGISDKKKDPLRGIFWTHRENSYVGEFGFPINPSSQWTLFRKSLDEDEERKKDQAKYIINNHDFKKDHTLVLFDRVADVDKFFEDFQKKYPDQRFYRMHGKVNKKERSENLIAFDSGGGILFAQYKTAGRGLDLPKCSKLFVLFPIKGENTLRQMVGRVVRWLPGKESYIYDWCDSALDFQWKKRNKIYKRHFLITPTRIDMGQPALLKT